MPKYTGPNYLWLTTTAIREFALQYDHYASGKYGIYHLYTFRNFLSKFQLLHGYHSYTKEIDLGKVTPEFNEHTAYFNHATGKVWKSVPGAIRGGDRQFLGNRVHGAYANALFGGLVKTFNYDDQLRLVNKTEDAHLFGGQVEMRFIRRDDRVIKVITGTGTGNFAGINEFFGPYVFR
ncbi:MAG: hypothetical protein AAF611_00080 [Bacteroidota bacterium]